VISFGHIHFHQPFRLYYLIQLIINPRSRDKGKGSVSENHNITSPQSPRVHLPVTYFLYRDTTFHLALALFALLCPKYGTPYLFTSANPKHTLPSDVILRRTTFFQPILLPSEPCNAPWFSSETLTLYTLYTLLLTYLLRRQTHSQFLTTITSCMVDGTSFSMAVWWCATPSFGGGVGRRPAPLGGGALRH